MSVWKFHSSSWNFPAPFLNLQVTGLIPEVKKFEMTREKELLITSREFSVSGRFSRVAGEDT